jgi:hypothetical protein
MAWALGVMPILDKLGTRRTTSPLQNHLFRSFVGSFRCSTETLQSIRNQIRYSNHHRRETPFQALQGGASRVQKLATVAETPPPLAGASTVCFPCYLSSWTPCCQSTLDSTHRPRATQAVMSLPWGAHQTRCFERMMRLPEWWLNNAVVLGVPIGLLDV